MRSAEPDLFADDDSNPAARLDHVVRLKQCEVAAGLTINALDAHRLIDLAARKSMAWSFIDHHISCGVQSEQRLCFRSFVDRRGNRVETELTRSLASLVPEHLKPGELVAVARSANKAEAIRAALVGGSLQGVLTDDRMARAGCQEVGTGFWTTSCSI